MQDEQITQNHDVFATWEIPEYTHYHRDFRWYAIAASVALALLIFSYFTDNFLLPVIIIIVAFIFIMRHGQEPDKIQVSLKSEGMTIGQKFFDYNEFRNFSIVYKPNQGDKNLYFEFQSVVKPRISIPLLDMDPVNIRRFLLTYLDEDLDRTDIPLSEQIAKKLKL